MDNAFYYNTSVYIPIDIPDYDKRHLKDYIIHILDKFTNINDISVYVRATLFIVDDVFGQPKLIIADYKYSDDNLYRGLSDHEEVASHLVESVKDDMSRDYLIDPFILLRLDTNNTYNDMEHKLISSKDDKVMALVGRWVNIVANMYSINTYLYRITFVKIKDDDIETDYVNPKIDRNTTMERLRTFIKKNKGFDIILLVKILPIQLFFTYNNIIEYNNVNNTNFKSFDDAFKYLESIVEPTLDDFIKAMKDDHAEAVHHIWMLNSESIDINDERIISYISNLTTSRYTLEVLFKDTINYLDLDRVLYYIYEELDIDYLINNSEKVIVIVRHILDNKLKPDFNLVSILFPVLAAVDSSVLFTELLKYYKNNISPDDIWYLKGLLRSIDNGEKYIKLVDSI
jgi:hypothetical protein